MSENTADNEIAGRIGDDTVLAEVEDRFRTGGRAIGALAAASLLAIAAAVLTTTMVAPEAPAATTKSPAAAMTVAAIEEPPEPPPVATVVPTSTMASEETGPGTDVEAPNAVTTPTDPTHPTAVEPANTQDGAAAKPTKDTQSTPKPPAKPAPKRPPEAISVAFDFNQIKVGFTDETKAKLERFADQCSSRVTLTGHTCNIGKESVNQVMGLIRAEAVSQVFSARGFAPDRIRVQSSGSQSPAHSNDTEEGRRQNRRVDVVCGS